MAREATGASSKASCARGYAGRKLRLRLEISIRFSEVIKHDFIFGLDA